MVTTSNNFTDHDISLAISLHSFTSSVNNLYSKGIFQHATCNKYFYKYFINIYWKLSNMGIIDNGIKSEF